MQINNVNATQNNRSSFKSAYAKVHGEWVKGGSGCRIVGESEVRRAVRKARKKKLFIVHGGRILTRPGNLTLGIINKGTQFVLTGKDVSFATIIKRPGTKLRQFIDKKFDDIFAFYGSSLHTTELANIE